MYKALLTGAAADAGREPHLSWGEPTGAGTGAGTLRDGDGDRDGSGDRDGREDGNGDGNGDGGDDGDGCEDVEEGEMTGEFANDKLTTDKDIAFDDEHTTSQETHNEMISA